MMSVLASLSLNRDGSFEVQYSSADDVSRLIVVCGSYSLVDACNSERSECTGRSLSECASAFNRGFRTLLGATDLTSLVAILSESNVNCFDIDYYAIVNVSTSELIAEHHINHDTERKIVHETRESSCGRIRARNYV